MHRAYAWDVIWVFGMIVEWHALQSHEVLLSIRARMNGRFCIKNKTSALFVFALVLFVTIFRAFAAIAKHSARFAFADHRCDDADNDSSTDQTSDSGIRFKNEMVDLSQIHDAPLYFVSHWQDHLVFSNVQAALKREKGC